MEFHAPCFKFIKQASIPLKPIALPAHLKWDQLYRKDVQLVQSNNKVFYDTDYIEDCIRISSALRTMETNELAAWGMTHRDGKYHVNDVYISLANSPLISTCWRVTCAARISSPRISRGATDRSVKPVHYVL